MFQNQQDLQNSRKIRSFFKQNFLDEFFLSKAHEPSVVLLKSNDQVLVSSTQRKAGFFGNRLDIPYGIKNSKVRELGEKFVTEIST